MNESNKQASVPASTDSSSSPGPYSVAPSHMTDSMSRYGQAVGMGPDALGRNLPPGSGPPPPPPPALSPWQGYVYGVDPAGRGLGPFPGQPYRSPYPAFSGQYSEPYDQYLGGPLPPDYPINIRFAGDKVGALENNGMGYAVMDSRTPSALPPFSSIATHPPSSGRGPTPGLKEDMGEFSEGLGARLSRGGSSGTPTPSHGGEFGEGLTARLMERSLSREDGYNSSSSLVQYRPWEIGPGGRPEPTSSSHASPTSPSSSYSFAEGFLKFQPGNPNVEKSGGGNNNVGASNNAAGGPNAGNSGRAEGPSPGTNANDDKSVWYQANRATPSPYSKDSSALPHPPPPTSGEKHSIKDGSGVPAANSATSIKSSNDMLSGSNLSNEPSRPPASSSVGYSGDGSSGAEDAKVHLTNSYPPYDGRDMLLSFGSPHQTSAYDYYPSNPATGGGPWGYSDMGKAANYHHVPGRPYSQNGRENVYGNGNPPDRQYQLSPHDKLSLQTTPPPPSAGGGGPAYQGNAHVPIHTKGGKSGRGHRGGGAAAAAQEGVGQVPSVSSSLQSQSDDSKSQIMGHDDYGPPPAKQAALASGTDEPGPPTEKPKKKKRKRCGECYGCQRKDNCGECAPCRNEKSHQICKMRRCEKLIERKANNPAPPPPPTTTHVQPPPPPPPTVSEKLQYLGGSGAGTAWW